MRWKEPASASGYCLERSSRSSHLHRWDVQVEELHGDKGINDLASASNTFSPSVLTS